MINWISNVLSGRYRHWNDENNTYVNDLVERAKQFPPAIKPLFTNFTMASYGVVESLIGPDQGRHKIIKKDSKKINGQQFQSLHHLNIWAFISIFCHQNPKFRDSFFTACQDFIGMQENERELTEKVLGMEELDVGEVCSILFPRVSKILEYESGDLLDWYKLTPYFSSAYTQALEAYKQTMTNNH